MYLYIIILFVRLSSRLVVELVLFGWLPSVPLLLECSTQVNTGNNTDNGSDHSQRHTSNNVTLEIRLPTYSEEQIERNRNNQEMNRMSCERNGPGC